MCGIPWFDKSPETFTAPVLANAHIYCRSYAGEVVCLRLDRQAAGE